MAEFISGETTEQMISLIETIINSTLGEDESEILESAVKVVELIIQKSNTLSNSTTSRITQILSYVIERAVSSEDQVQDIVSSILPNFSN